MKNQTNYLIRLAEFLLVIGLLGYLSYSGNLKLHSLLRSLCWGYLCSYLVIETEYIFRKISNPLVDMKDSYKEDFLVHRLLRCSLVLVRVISPVLIGVITIMVGFINNGLSISEKILLFIAGYLLIYTSIDIITDFRYEFSKRR